MTDLPANVMPMARRHAAAVARLHAEGIPTGFLSSLGQRFLKQLYIALPRCPAGFGYVWVDDDQQVQGFICCTESTGRVYKQALRRRALFMGLPLLRHMLRPRTIKRMIHTLRYPNEVAEADKSIPVAELLSIVVAEGGRGKGVGKALVAAADAEFRRRDISQYKVAVWDQNDSANAFYQRCGFELTLQRTHHDLGMNIYTKSA